MKALVPCFLLLAACSPTPTCPDPFYDGKGSDEAWRTMQDGEGRATKDDTKAISLSVPTEGVNLPASAAPKFVWTTPLTASLIPPPRPSPSVLARLGDLVYSSAWAHLPPVTGPVHWLRISVPKKSCAIALITTRTEWTPSTEAWAQLKDTKGATLSMDVFSAYLTENRITEGPYHLSKPVTFTVGP